MHDGPHLELPNDELLEGEEDGDRVEEDTMDILAWISGYLLQLVEILRSPTSLALGMVFLLAVCYLFLEILTLSCLFFHVCYLDRLVVLQFQKYKNNTLRSWNILLLIVALEGVIFWFAASGWTLQFYPTITSRTSIVRVFYVSAICDMAMQMPAVAIKALFISRRWYSSFDLMMRLSIIEQASRLFRQSLPFLLLYQIYNSWHGILITVGVCLYCTLKCYYMLHRLYLFTCFSASVAFGKTSIGERISPQDFAGVLEEGSCCAVCFENFDNSAFRLHCGHTFCENCVLDWTQRSNTCPICRAEIDAHLGEPGTDGSSLVWPYIF